MSSPFDVLSKYLVRRVLRDKTTTGTLHGMPHWEQVANNGAEIAAAEPEVDGDVVLLFALFHDSMRLDDGADPLHGHRAAAYVHRMRNDRMYLQEYSEQQIIRLRLACFHHTSAKTSDEITIGACYDADRLDLGRVGIVPDPEFFSTETGRRMASE